MVTKGCPKSFIAATLFSMSFQFHNNKSQKIRLKRKRYFKNTAIKLFWTASLSF
jgi:hypothetical protein